MNQLRIAERYVGEGHPTFIIAELSANHGQDPERAIELVHAAARAGADAVKLQTYTPDTMTIRSSREWFRIGPGTLWEGRTLYDLYGEASTPWEWHPRLQEAAAEAGVLMFSTPFDPTAVGYLERLDMPAYKIASFEILDLALIRAVAETGKPIILSTGMATLDEIEDAVGAAREAGNEQLALLKCTSGYPAAPDEMNLRTIPDLRSRFEVPIGLSDHTLGVTVAVAAVALGARIVEKHFTLSRDEPGPDSAFSLEPVEFEEMVDAVRTVERALGEVHYGTSERESASRVFRRSLFVVADMAAGDRFTEANVRAIRPGHGLAPKHLEKVLGCRAATDIELGTPLSWDLVRR
jgi:N-acetylneuraminate synthase